MGNSLNNLVVPSKLVVYYKIPDVLVRRIFCFPSGLTWVLNCHRLTLVFVYFIELSNRQGLVVSRISTASASCKVSFRILRPSIGLWLLFILRLVLLFDCKVQRFSLWNSRPCFLVLLQRLVLRQFLPLNRRRVNFSSVRNLEFVLFNDFRWKIIVKTFLNARLWVYRRLLFSVFVVDNLS